MKPRLRWKGTGGYFPPFEHEAGVWVEVRKSSVTFYAPPSFLVNGVREYHVSTYDGPPCQPTDSLVR